MNIIFLSAFLSLFTYTIADPIVCEGNRFKYISSYELGRQDQLTKTFAELQPMVHVDNVAYKDQVFRTYTIFPQGNEFSYAQIKQTYDFKGINLVQITGGTLRISYDFKWEKKQLTSSINGTGKITATTDPITFTKTLSINDNHQLQWNLNQAKPITFSNSLILNKIDPYNENDYKVINLMLNALPNNQTTFKMNLIKGLNKDYANVLKKIVHESNDTWKESKFIEYSYTDYRKQFIADYDNYIRDLNFTEDGLKLILTQTLQNYPDFECGDKVPTQPEDKDEYGGIQEYTSNSLLKSTLRYAIKNGSLDVLMTQEFWQSSAFQFRVGDLHQIMPSTKNISTLEEIVGRCKAFDDKAFKFEKKTPTSYQVDVNFTCQFSIGEVNFLNIDTPISYEVVPTLTYDHLDFMVKSITAKPTFTPKEGYEIKNMDLLMFMVDQTLKMGTNTKVIGSGYKTIYRRTPNLMVRDKYLFMYDSAAPPSKLSDL